MVGLAVLSTFAAHHPKTSRVRGNHYPTDLRAWKVVFNNCCIDPALLNKSVMELGIYSGTKAKLFWASFTRDIEYYIKMIYLAPT